MPRSRTTFPKGRGLGHGGDANGPGWGGPAKGTRPRPDNLRLADGEYNPRAGTVGSKAAQRRERALQVLEDVMEMSEHDAVRVAAADKLLDRIEGKPVQKVVTPQDAAEWFIEGVVEAETVEEWTQRAKLLTGPPAGSAD